MAVQSGHASDHIVNAFTFGWCDDGRLTYSQGSQERAEAQHAVGKSTDAYLCGDGGQQRLPVPAFPLGSLRRTRASRCAAGGRHSLYAQADGSVKASGWNGHGQLGTGDREGGPSPALVQFPPATHVTSVYTGGLTSYALTGDGKVYSWGCARYGALAHLPKAESDAAAVEKRRSDSRARRRRRQRRGEDAGDGDGDGDDSDGGGTNTATTTTTTYVNKDGATLDAALEAAKAAKDDKRFPDELQPKLIERFMKLTISQLSVGKAHAIAMSTGGRVYGWGRNQHGQLGIGEGRNTDHGIVYDSPEWVVNPREIRFSGGDKPQMVAAGHEHCAALVRVTRANLKEEVVVFAWGRDADKRLGGVDDRRTSVPQEVVLVSNFMRKIKKRIASVVCGGAHNILITEMTQEVITWGAGAYGQLGNGHCWDRADPQLIPGLASIKQVCAGMRHSLALEQLGEQDDSSVVWAWGYNGYGELGLGDAATRLQPHVVRAFATTQVVKIAAGERHSIVLTTGVVKKARDLEEYAEYFRILQDEGHLVYNVLKKDMISKGLEPSYLDNPDQILPGQPGVEDAECPVSAQEPGMRYCLDTVPQDTEDTKRPTYETAYGVPGLKLERICCACARTCHSTRYVEAKFLRYRPEDRCKCCLSKYCTARWSVARREFDRIADRNDDTAITTAQIRELLEALHDGLVLDEDLEQANTALQPPDDRVLFDPFDKWHTEYYKKQEIVEL